MKISRMIALFCVIAVMSACGEKTPEGGTVLAPTNLTITSITPTGATLGWSGNADSFQVEINSKTESTEVNSYNVAGLTPETKYSWRVRAIINTQASKWVNGTDFTTLVAGSVGTAKVSVNFDDGSEVWTAAYMEAETNGNDLGLFFSKVPKSGQEAGFIPAVEAFVKKTGETSFNFLEPADNDYYFEYYSEKYWDRVLTDESGDYYFGDWEVFSGKITITSSGASLISGSAEIVLLDSYDYWGNENTDNYAKKNMTVTFNDIPLATAASRVGKQALVGENGRSVSRIYKAKHFRK